MQINGRGKGAYISFDKNDGREGYIFYNNNEFIYWADIAEMGLAGCQPIDWLTWLTPDARWTREDISAFLRLCAELIGVTTVKSNKNPTDTIYTIGHPFNRDSTSFSDMNSLRATIDGTDVADAPVYEVQIKNIGKVQRIATSVFVPNKQDT